MAVSVWRRICRHASQVVPDAEAGHAGHARHQEGPAVCFSQQQHGHIKLILRNLLSIRGPMHLLEPHSVHSKPDSIHACMDSKFNSRNIFPWSISDLLSHPINSQTQYTYSHLTDAGRRTYRISPLDLKFPIHLHHHPYLATHMCIRAFAQPPSLALNPPEPAEPEPNQVGPKKLVSLDRPRARQRAPMLPLETPRVFFVVDETNI